MNKRKRCCVCRQLTHKWQAVNGGSAYCYDGCHSTTGRDNRTVDGEPAWLPYKSKPAFDKSRMWNNYKG